MSRPKTSTGTYSGEIKTKFDSTRKAWRAWCRYGDIDGETRLVQAYGKTKPVAVDKLKKKLVGRKYSGRREIGTTYSPDMTVLEMALAWLADYERDSGLRPQSIDQYRREIQGAPNPKPDTMFLSRAPLGRMRIGAVRASHIAAYLAEFPSPTIRRWNKTILTKSFDAATDNDAIDRNPVGRTSPTPANRTATPEPRAFTDAELARFRHLETEYFARPGCRADARFRDMTALLYQLGGRTGEMLAVRWADVDLEAGTVTVTGTVVYSRQGEGTKKTTWRQDYPKTEQSVRTVKVSAECLLMLRRRKLAARPGHTLVFCTRTGKPINPGTGVNEIWNAIVEDTDLEWSVPKTLRKTAATKVDSAHGEEAAQALIGHTKGSKVTGRHYIDRPKIVADYSTAL